MLSHSDAETNSVRLLVWMWSDWSGIQVGREGKKS